MKQMKVFLKLIPYLRSVLASIIAGIVTGVIHQLVAIAGSAFGAYLVSRAILGAAPKTIMQGIFFLIALMLLRTLFSYLEMWYAHKAAYGILAQLRVKIYRAIEKIAPAYLMNKRTGELSSTLMADVETLEWFYAHTYGAAIIAIAVPVIVLMIIAIVIHPLVALVLVPWLFLMVTIPFWFKKMSDADGKLIREKLASINAEVVDGIQGVREILSFGYESWYLKQLRAANKALTSVQKKYGSRQGLENGISNLVMSAGLLSVTVVSVFLMHRGLMERQWYSVAIILSIYVFTPVVSISSMARNFGIMQSATDRVFTVLETPQTVKDLVEESTPLADKLDISFEHVDFRYKEDLPLVLKDVSFTVSPGETVALVGHSGAGKSTCANLLLRFWDIEKGSIRIGGVDIRDLKQTDLRSRISVVPQDVYLFNDTILNNIRLGRPDASKEEVIKAAKDARIHDFIEGLPQGYETVAGERGVQLSGGERQRIAIARALLQDTPILLMDEAVSNLDTKNEEELRKAMEKLNENRTTLTIAHRLSTILSADRIVVLEDGKVAQSGTHSEMMKKDGAYSRLIHSQYKQS